MKEVYCILIFCAGCLAGLPAQDKVQDTLQVRDRVDVPLVFGGDRDQQLVADTREHWILQPGRARLRKEVDSLRFLDLNAENTEPVPVTTSFRANLTYEFFLVDPESLEASDLHAPMIQMVRKYVSTATPYNLQETLLSVRFREQWTYEAANGKLEKVVLEMIPVIWQRRQTREGEALNDPDTGLPVYYKLDLAPVRIRNF
jgi:hypothetical protein